MNTREEQDRNKKLEDDPRYGGMSAGAQDGGIIDAGAADNSTDYNDALAGRPEDDGAVPSDASGRAETVSDPDFVAGADFQEEDELPAIGRIQTPGNV